MKQMKTEYWKLSLLEETTTGNLDDILVFTTQNQKRTDTGHPNKEAHKKPKMNCPGNGIMRKSDTSST